MAIFSPDNTCKASFTLPKEPLPRLLRIMYFLGRFLSVAKGYPSLSFSFMIVLQIKKKIYFKFQVIFELYCLFLEKVGLKI